MIDLILHCPTGKADLVEWAKSHPPVDPLWQQVGEDEQGNPVYGRRPGLDYCWWAGSGQFMTAAGTYDQDGNEITAPTFLNGVVVMLRIHGDLFLTDKLEPDENDPDKDEQYARSRVARYIKNNGVQGGVGGITYYELDGVRIFRARDVFDWLAANNLPGHEWIGGNAL